MRLLFLIVLASGLFLARFATGQPTIPVANLPGDGDTFVLATDQLPTGIRVQGPGQDLRWDFTSLQAPFSRRHVWRQLPGAKGGIQHLSASTTNFSEAIFHKTATEVRLHSAYGKDPFGLSPKSHVVYTPSLPLRKLPQRYGSRYQYKGSAVITAASSDAPSALLRKLPFRPDSLRLKVSILLNSETDAWGKIIIPGGIFEVLREKQTQTFQFQLEARIGQRRWQNISSLTPMNELFPRTSATTYYFWSNDALEPIATVATNPANDTPESVDFKVTDLKEIPNLNSSKPDIFAYPNPAIVSIRLEFFNLPAGEYELSIYNLLGTPLIKKKYFVSGNRTEKLDISELRKGTYLYNLKDERGNSITTKRLIVIRP